MLFVFGTVSMFAFFIPLVLLGAVIVIIGAISAISSGRAVERMTDEADQRDNARHAH